MNEYFDKNFWKHYQFWILVCSALSILAVAFFSMQSYKVQLVLRAIEETRQREKFSNDLEILFSTNALEGCEPENATYDLKLINKSANSFNDLETTTIIFYENPLTKDLVSSEAFTFPRKQLVPTDLPVCLVENPDLTRIICFNISETKKTIPTGYKPKYFEFHFRWAVEISENKYLSIQKRRSFMVRR